MCSIITSKGNIWPIKTFEHIAMPTDIEDKPLLTLISCISSHEKHLMTIVTEGKIDSLKGGENVIVSEDFMELVNKEDSTTRLYKQGPGEFIWREIDQNIEEKNIIGKESKKIYSPEQHNYKFPYTAIQTVVPPGKSILMLQYKALELTFGQVAGELHLRIYGPRTIERKISTTLRELEKEIMEEAVDITKSIRNWIDPEQLKTKGPYFVYISFPKKFNYSLENSVELFNSGIVSNRIPAMISNSDPVDWYLLLARENKDFEARFSGSLPPLYFLKDE